MGKYGRATLHRMNGNSGPGPLLISARCDLLTKLLALQEETPLQLISPEELLLIQQMWKAARDPDDGRGVARYFYSDFWLLTSDSLRLCRAVRDTSAG